MLLDFDQAETPLPARADVCILGAGAAGILLATELAAAGRSIVVLEGGGLEHEGRSQAIYKSELAGLPHHGVHDGRFRTYGGSTTRWGGQMLPLAEQDFQQREWVPGSGWPFGKEELLPYYERALQFAGLRRVERDDATVRRALGVTLPELGPEFEQLYSRWLPERNVAVLHGRRLRESRRITGLLHANAVGFRMATSGDAIAAVKVRGFSGRVAEIEADNVVVAMGGIESTRLLLQPTAEGVLPWQVGGMVGRHYQDHLSVNGIAVMGLQPELAMRQFGYVESRGFRFHNKILMSPAWQQRERTLNVAGTLGPFVQENRARDVAMESVRAMVRLRRLPPLGELVQMGLQAPGIAVERMRSEASRWRRLMLTVHAEQEPRSASIISLADERDELGLLRTRLRWVISDEELATVRAYVRTATEVFARRGLARVEPPEGFYEDDGLLRAMCGDSYHHMGGTVMGQVVDANLRLRGVRNGYVCSSSVFPSSGFSNPTHTVMALAMRLADRLAGVAEVRARAAMREVVLPGSGRSVPQLGFGCAYLLSAGLDRSASRRLLDAAYDAGVRHFDVARLYGMGRTEGLLGEFLAEHPEATVATKFGVVPPSAAERVAMAASRRLGREWKRKDKARFGAKEARASLEMSLRELRRERVELFLLHEATVEDLVHDDLLEFLVRQREAGVIGEFGVGGEASRVAALYRERRQYVPVLQFENSVLGPAVDVAGSWRVHYRVFAPAVAALGERFAREPDLARRGTQEVGADLQEPEVLAKLLLRASLDANAGTLTLFSSRTEQRVYGCVAAATEAWLAEPAQRLLGWMQREICQPPRGTRKAPKHLILRGLKPIRFWHTHSTQSVNFKVEKSRSPATQPGFCF
jgi:aryl-alcohol dehydrogenase-like predicted oxidoreductase/choline dehydrogenase-like flavoprotein